MTPAPENAMLQFDAIFSDTYSATLAVQQAVNYWHANGFTLWIPETYYLPTNHRLPVHILAIPCYLSANYAEVGIPWNAFYSIVTAATVLAVAILLKVPIMRARRAFYIALCLPFSWLVAGYYKDILLQACMGVTLASVLASWGRPGALVLALGFGTALIAGFRPPYIAVMAAFALYIAVLPRRFAKVSTGILLCFLVASAGPVVEVSLSFWRSYAVEAEWYANPKPFSYDTGVLSPVKRTIVGLLTPFPWTQPFEVGLHGWFQIPEYAQASLTLAVLSVVLPSALAQLRSGDLPSPAFAFAALFMLAAIFNPGAAIHATYVQVAAVFFLPDLYKGLRAPLGQRLLASLALMLVGNVLWLGIRGS